MTLSAFRRTASSAGLTLRALSALSLCQSQIYHEIRFCGQEDTPDLAFYIESPAPGLRRILRHLHESGLVDLVSRHRARVTGRGWQIPCNAGAQILLGPASPEDVLLLSQTPPLTRYGPRFPAETA